MICSKYVLIGVAVYSPKALKLLDAINAANPEWRDIATVAVFDLMECKHPFDILIRYFLAPTYRSAPFLFNSGPQSPIVGIWDGAALSALETGLYDTQKLLRNEQLLK